MLARLSPASLVESSRSRQGPSSTIGNNLTLSDIAGARNGQPVGYDDGLPAVANQSSVLTSASTSSQRRCDGQPVTATLGVVLSIETLSSQQVTCGLVLKLSTTETFWTWRSTAVIADKYSSPRRTTDRRCLVQPKPCTIASLSIRLSSKLEVPIGK